MENDKLATEQLASPVERLTTRQRRFAEAFTGTAGGNARQAAIEAGYSPASAHVLGCRLKKIKGVSDAISKLQAERREAATISHQFVLDGFLSTLRAATTEGPGYSLATANKALENLGRHIGFYAASELPTNNTVNVLVSQQQEWIGLRNAIISALKEYPEARAAVMAALRGQEDTDPAP